MNSNVNKELLNYYIIYYLCLLGLFFCSFFPEFRIWGLNIWAYYSIEYKVLFLATGSFLPAIMKLPKIKALLFTHDYNISKNRFYILAAFAGVCFITLFYLLRAKTFFLGDGYTILGLTSQDNPLIEKYRQWGESLIHIYLYRILGRGSYQNAILSYQIISIVAGAAAFGSLVILSKFIKNYLKRFLFIIGTFTGGFVLLYFGYVENYSIFTLIVLIYCLISLNLEDNAKNRILLLGISIISMFFHIFGVALLIPTLFNFVIATTIGQKIIKKRVLKIATATVLSLTVLTIFFYFYDNNLFFRFSMVPVLSDQFTIENYSLFSIAHILDLFNLIIVLIPSLLILILFVLRNRSTISLTRNEKLLIFVGFCSLGISVIFDPKLGMPRDWDLFSFFSIPIIVLLLSLLVKQYRNSKPILILVILLNLLILLPRTALIHSEDTSIKHFNNYIELDKIKNRNSWIFLIDYYKQKGDTLAADSVLHLWNEQFPEKKMIAEANNLYYNKRDFQATLNLLYKLKERNPVYSDVYSFLGFCYLDTKKYDSALILIKIADALSPNRPNNISNLADAYFHLGNINKAEEYYLKAAKLNPNDFQPFYNLSAFYENRSNPDLMLKYLEEASKKDNAPAVVYKKLIFAYMFKKDYQSALNVLNATGSLKTDTTFLRQLNQNFPEVEFYAD